MILYEITRSSPPTLPLWTFAAAMGFFSTKIASSLAGLGVLDVQHGPAAW